MPHYNASIHAERPDFVEPGDYKVEVVDATETMSRSNHEMIELKLRTSEGSYLYDFLVFTPSAFWKIDAFRAATGETVIPEHDVEISADDLVGRKGLARLVVEEYNGRKRNKVAAWLEEIGGGCSERGQCLPETTNQLEQWNPTLSRSPRNHHAPTATSESECKTSTPESWAPSQRLNVEPM